MVSKLDRYYEKFDEDKRLSRRHGQVEFLTSMKYIEKALAKYSSPKILDIGAGTGAYSVPLANKGYDVTSVEVVKKNLEILRQKQSKCKTFLADARNLEMLKDEAFDVVLLFGPMYHLLEESQKLQALLEAKRVTKCGGTILVAYYMNEYAILTHGFKNGAILQSQREGRVDKNFHIVSKQEDLYSFVRVDDIKRLAREAQLKRQKLVATDGASDYMRQTLNQMDEQTFAEYLDFHFSICERPELVGASSHTLDILTKQAK